jgi:two-component system NtrC family sensor kinase
MGNTDRMANRRRVPYSEQYFGSLIENALDAILTLDGEGRITYASPSIERMGGYRPEELVGRSAFEIIHPNDVPFATASLGRVMKDIASRHHIQLRCRHADGSWRPVEVIVYNRLSDPNVQGIIVNLRDITEQKRAEEALREAHDLLESRVEARTAELVEANELLRAEVAERRRVEEALRASEEKFRQFLEGMSDGYCVLQRYEVAYVNSRAAEMFGYTQDEVMGKSLNELLPESMVKELAAIHRRRQSGQDLPVWYESALIEKDGVELPVEMGARRTEYGGKPAVSLVIRDITARKTMEAALKESEQRLRTVFDKSAIGMAMLRLDGTPVEINPALEKIFGYKMSELLSLDHVKTEDGLADAKRFTEMVEGKRDHYRVEKRYRRKDGAIVWAHQTLSLLRDAAGEPAFMIAMVEDITDRKLAEEAVRESQQKYRDVVERAHEGICIVQDGVVKYANPRVRHILGYGVDEIVGMPIDRFVHRDEVGKVAERYRRRIAGEDVEGSYETSLLHKDGTRVEVEMNAGVVTYEGRPADLGMFRDITKRKEFERALRQSEERLRKYLGNSPDAIYINDMQGRLLYGNKAAERMIGYSVEELVGKSFLDLDILDGEYLSKAVVTLKLNADGRSTGPDEFRLRRKDGSLVQVEISTCAIGEGENTEVIGIARDITERKRAEHEKHKMEQQLLLAGRLAAVGELAAGVAHEVNNPLTAIQAFAQFLAGREDLDESMKKDVETIYREAQRAARITGSLLSFARRHKPEKGMMSVNKAVEASIELQEYRLRVNNIAIVKDLAPELPETMADFHQLQQVFVNIINNAEQAMKEAHGKGKLVIKTRFARDLIRVAFEDNGPGVAEHNLKGIFDPFFTTKDVGEGTGLGLSICYGIMQEHGGHLYVKNRPGKGATFVVELPVVAQAETGLEPAIESRPSV